MNAVKLLLLGTMVATACTASVNVQSQDEKGLPQTCSANAPDPRACNPSDTKKTTVCHIPPGNPANAHTICVGNAAVPAHMDHGDFLGTCSCTGSGSGSGGGGGGGGMGSGGGGGSGTGGGGGLQ
ncbi:MAG: hypothetical protein ACM31C_01235 [Acidobacteriota bacterium]